jgi:hypothetical protein
MSSLSDALILEPYPFEIWISTRSDSAGSGTLNDPFGASTATLFDSLMTMISGQAGPVLVHLGPGVFQTTGYSDQATTPGWQMKAGMRIVGAGKDVTTLQLVSTVTDRQYFAIGHKLSTGASPDVPNPVNYAEVSDLTVDANLGGQSAATVACGAVRLMGNHVKIERVKAKNWGNKGSSPPLCFVFAVLTGDRSVNNTDVSNAGIQDCVGVEPATPTGSVTVFHAGGTEATARNDEAFGKGPYIRRCFVDCGTLGASALTADIRALSMGWCRAGVIEQNQIHNLKIGGPYQDKTTTREIVVRSNTYKNVVRGPWWFMDIDNAPLARSVNLVQEGSTDIAVATLTAHLFQVGDRVKIDATGGAPEFKGMFVVKEIVDADNFKYQMQQAPGSGPGTSRTCRKIFGVGNILVERNIIELAKDSSAQFAIHADDDKQDSDASTDTPGYIFTEVVIRENRIRYLDGDFGSGWTGRAIKVCGARNVLIRDNISELALANPIQNFRCGTAQYFNNKSPRGALIQGYEGVGQTKYSELETESEDALLFTLM